MISETISTILNYKALDPSNSKAAFNLPLQCWRWASINQDLYGLFLDLEQFSFSASLGKSESGVL